MFLRDVRGLTESELANAVRECINSREPESLCLDYKEALDISKESGKSKKELAKDVSSFANEQGGTLIYGVPEERDGDLPRPKPLAECGMDIPGGMPERVEDILLGAVEPVLHALTIKVLDIEEIHPRKLLLVHHPESYWKPHMVQGYEDARYYRRGEFRAIKMTEREVEAAYRAREAARRHAQDFFATASFGPAPGVQIRAVACPVIPGRFKDRMLQPGFRDWLDANKPMGPDHPRRGEWLPFLDGWRFLAFPEGATAGKEYEIRVFHNGAVCLNLDPQANCLEAGVLLLDEVEKNLQNLFVGYCSTVLKELALRGPVVIRFELAHAHGLRAAVSTKEFRKMRGMREQIRDKGVAVVQGGWRVAAPEEPGHPYTDGDRVVFEEESSTEEMSDSADKVLGRLVTRIGTAFGLWGGATG